jgi:hypothetical protein
VPHAARGCMQLHFVAPGAHTLSLQLTPAYPPAYLPTPSHQQMHHQHQAS